jgi:VanZ family protein
MRWIHNALYLSGPGEVIGNYFLYAPIVFLSSFLFPRLSLGYRVLLGCAASGFVELTQLVIPGRVSSLRDFLTNCTGVVIAGLIERWVRSVR